MSNKNYSTYNDIKNIISKTNKKVFKVEDFHKWIELLYNNDIILTGTKVIYTSETKNKFIWINEEEFIEENKKTKKITKKEREKYKKEREKLFNILNENYNSYISNDAQVYLYASLNNYFLKDFIKNNIEKDIILHAKEEKNNIFKTLNIIKTIFTKYFLYSKENPEEDEIILSYDEILNLGSIVLDNIFYLSDIVKDKFTDKEEYIIRKLIELFFIRKKSIMDIQTINLLNMTISSSLFLFDSLFYKELTENLPRILDYKKDVNKEFLIRIYEKFLKRKKVVLEELEKDNIIAQDLNDIEANFDKIIKDNKIDFDKEKILEQSISEKNETIIPTFEQDNSNSSYTEKKKNDEKKEKELKEKRKKILIKKYKEKEKIKKNLKKNIIGQDEIIDNIVDKHLHKLFLWLNKRPISMVFAWDSGLGKTELSKQIAKELDFKPLLIHMWNLKHSHMDTTLLGSPPSYVGFNEPTALEKYLIEAEENWKIPVIVFDEIEKGHQSIQNIYLEILDEWKITFSNWNTFDLKQAIIIMTSNLGVSEIKKTKIGLWNDDNTMSHENIDYTIKKNIKEFFRPEVLNRINDIYIFKNLKDKEIDIIINNVLSKVIKSVKNNEIIKELFGESDSLKKLNVSKVKNLLKKENIELNTIENIRKIESEAENIVIKYLEN